MNDMDDMNYFYFGYPEKSNNLTFNTSDPMDKFEPPEKREDVAEPLDKKEMRVGLVDKKEKRGGLVDKKEKRGGLVDKKEDLLDSLFIDEYQTNTHDVAQNQRSSPLLEYSVMHEKQIKEQKNEDETVRLLFKNKYSHVWVDDASVTSCGTCEQEFGLFFRRHHCRYCKNIFCSNCTPYRRQIPDTWGEGETQHGKLVRVCEICNKQIDVLEKIHHLILIFNYAVVDIKTLCRLAQVSKLWNYLASYYQGKIRNIQYKKLGHPMSRFDRDVLRINKHLWIGHSHWSILYLQSLSYHSPAFKRKEYSELIQFLMSIDFNLSSVAGNQRGYKCLNLMCSKNCLSTFRPYHAIILLDFVFQEKINIPELYQFIIKILKQASDIELNLYLPYLIHKFTEHGQTSGVISVAQFLIDRCKRSSELALETYWILMYCFNTTKHQIFQFYLDDLLHNVEPEIVQILNSSQQFVTCLQYMPTNSAGGMTMDRLYRVKKYFREKEMTNLIIPFDSYSRVNYVVPLGIEIKKSATCPVLIPINCRRKDCQDLDCYLLYKLENVHQDYVVLKAIRLMKYLLYSLNGIELETVDYQVRPIDANSGIVQVVPDCLTVYEIKEKMRFSIFNYITENNPDETVDNLRKKFVQSCAAYCVITYLLGVGDRHLDNIMITTEGKLFHIDYGFILGSDPKPISQPKIRITEDMIDALGGRNSIYYQDFIKLCNDIYQAMRGHLKLFIHFMSILTNGEDEYQRLVKVLTSRFIPGETKKTAIVQLETEIFKSSTHYSAPVIDFFHRHNKENTLKQAGHQLGKALSGLWNYGSK